MTRSVRPRRPSVPTLVTTLLLGALGLALPAGTAGAASTSSSSSSSPSATAGEDNRPTDPIAHDPTIVREGDWYYVAITGDAGPDDTYLPMKRSRDLLNWE